MTRMLALAAALFSVAQVTQAQTAVPPPPPEETAPAAPAAEPAPAQAAPAPAAQPAPAQAAPPPAALAPAQPAPAQPAPAVAQPAPPPPQAAPAAAPTQAPSRRRNFYTWGSVGTTFAYGETYASAAFGVGYLMKFGITPNFEVSYAFANTPTVWSLRPGVTWFMPVPMLHPYVGAYYARWLVNDLPDENGVGARAGLSLGRLVSLGVTYERALDCSGDNCDSWSPQISAGFSM